MTLLQFSSFKILNHLSTINLLKVDKSKILNPVMLFKAFPLKTFCLLIASLFFLRSEIFSQDYTQDSLAVRAILDSNGLQHLTVEFVSEKDQDRITTLLLTNQGIKALPKEIGILTGLRVLHLGLNELISLPPEIGYLIKMKKML